ncbi:MAG: tetratricopeptide repeat protein [Gemmatimonadota bacterium]|nr:MAG: tetratricopeptide repeat protein [Gemmatimonadota bacterium]
MRQTLALLAILSLAACGATHTIELPDLPNGGQAISLFGDTLYPTTPTLETQAGLEQQLAAAQAAYDQDPADADAIIWLGRRHAYLGHYRQAIRIYSDGIATHRDDARMYRHRGHRFITLRMFDRAIADFARAAELTAGMADEIEPDGQPNAAGIPTSTLQFNIWYHMGLAHYLKGDFEQAVAAYRECMERSDIPDRLVATSHWLYMTLRRLGRDAEAAAVLEPIHPGMEIIENHAYYNLLLMYRGETTPEELLGPEEDAVQSATVAYGVGNWHYYNGREDEADRILRSILAGEGWAAFGHIAAEADLHSRSTAEH